MSKQVDERVVSMQFDNAQFERNVATTMSTLDKLKQKLNFSGASKGLEDVSASAKKVDMTGLANGVETVRTRFSAMEVAGVTALANITNQAVNAGKRMLSALTIDPIKTGFAEYETQINAVQTILANTKSKGTTIDDVNTALDTLNTYADKTIYNFTEMTRNIGTFTAAGVDLDTSVKSIQGIANLAAVSGSSSQQASTAMYQLSQALAAGKVSLMDWNSVVNAGMGGEVFQNALKRTAKAMGTDVDAIIKKYGSFRESLTQGEWLTTDVLTKTLEQFTMAAEKGSEEWEKYKKSLMDSGYTEKQAEEILEMANTATDAATKVKTFTQLWDTLKEAAQSGWTQTWEIIVGDFEEAKELLTNVSNVLGEMIGKSAEARNAVLQGWKDEGGRTMLVESLANAFEALMSVVTPIKEAFTEIFPPITVKQLLGFTEGLKNFTESLKLGKTASDDLKRTFKGLFAVVDIVRQVFVAVFQAIKPVFGGLDDLGGGILGVTASIGDWLVKLNETIKSTDILGKAAEKVADFITKMKQVIVAGVDAIKSFAESAKEKFGFPGMELFHSLLERVHARLSNFMNTLSDMKSGTVSILDAIVAAFVNSGFLKALSTLWNGVKTIVSGIASALGTLVSTIFDKLGNANFSGLFDFINTLSLSGIAVFIAKFIKGFGDMGDAIGGFKENALGILEDIRGCFAAYQEQLKAGTLLKIASAIAILVGAIVVLSFIDSDKLSTAIGAITMLFVELMGSMAIFSKISGPIKGVTKAIGAMFGISVSVLILATALKKIGDLEFGEMVTGLIGILGLTAIVVGAAKTLATSSGDVIKGAVQMVIFAAAVKILAGVCEQLSRLKWGELVKGLVGVGVLLAEISIFLNTANFSGRSISTAAGVVILAYAITILAKACEAFAQMHWEDLGKGLGSIAVLLLAIAGFTKLTSNSQHVIATGVALIAIAAAMKIFASAIKDLGSLSWEQIAKGLVAMALALTAVTIAVRLMPKNIIGIGVGLIAVAAALVILSVALEKMGNLTWEQLAKGLITLGGSMLILAVGLKAMTGTLSGAAALLVAVAALALLAPVLSVLGAMSWGAIAKGLVAIAGAFAIIGIAGALLGPIVPSILGLSASLLMVGIAVLGIGAGLLAAGAGLSALAVGFTALSTAGIAGSTAFVAALTVIVTGIAGLIPVVIAELGRGLIVLCQVIAEGAPAIGEAVKAIILTLVDVLVECVPAVADGLLSLLTAVLASLVEYGPQIVDYIFDYIILILQGVASRLPELIQAAVDVLKSFFSGILSALGNIDTSTLFQGIIAVGLMSGIMIALGAVAGLVPAAMLGVLGMGAVIAEMALVLAAIGALAQIPGLDWLIGEGGQLLQSIGTAIGQFVGGLIGGVAQGIASVLPQIGFALSQFMLNATPFIVGIKMVDASMLEGVGVLTAAILALTAADFIAGISSFIQGGSSFAALGTELSLFMTNVQPFIAGASQFNEDTLRGVQMLADTILTLTKANVLEGLTAWFTGGTSLSEFSAQLVPFGEAMATFSQTVAGNIDEEAVMAAANAGKIMAEMATTLPNSGGVVGFFTGENDIETFGAQIVSFGSAMVLFSSTVAGNINEEAIISAANAGKIMLDFAATLPNTGGAVSWFTGDNDMETFGTQLVSFGNAMVEFSQTVSGNINEGAIAAATNAGYMLAALANSLPDSGGFGSWFSADNDMSTFGKELKSFGESLADFSDEVSGVDCAQLAAVTTRLRNLVSMATSMSGVDFSSLGSFGKNLKKIGKDGIDLFINAFKDAENRVSTTVKAFVDKGLDAINKKDVEFKNAGSKLVEKFADGIEAKKETPKSKAKTMAGDAAAAIKDKYQSFYNAGSYLVDGFAAGISENTFKAEAEAAAMAAAALEAAEEELGIQSPSKEFYKIGAFTGQGFINALRVYADKAYQSTAEMAKSARSGLSDAIGRVVDVFNTDMDTQPTIRPVVDLSNVKTGAAAISSMFDTTSSVGVLAKVGKINSMMNDRIQNGDNSDVVSAIEKLRSELSNVGGTSYHIDGVTYDDGSNIAEAMQEIVKAAKIERRM